MGRQVSWLATGSGHGEPVPRGQPGCGGHPAYAARRRA